VNVNEPHSENIARRLIESVADNHAPQRPSWDCIACDEPWPCRPAKIQMLNEARNSMTSLRIAAWANFELAAYDMPTGPAIELYQRFVGWMSLPPLN
jgi:hypothetical protein